MSILNLIQIGVYILQYGQTVWQNLTPYLDPDDLPEFTPCISDKFEEFSLKVRQPKDSSGDNIIITNKDLIAITSDNSKTEILNNTLVGLPVFQRKKFLELGDSSADSAIEFDISEIRQKNYSYGFYEVDLPAGNLSDFLDYIFNDDRILPAYLGGTLANGTTISKYDLPANLDVTIPAIKRFDETKGHLDFVLKMLEYNSRLFFHSEPNATNLLNIIGQVKIRENFTPEFLPLEWQNGLNRAIINNGVTANPYYDSTSDTGEPEYMPCESEIELEEDSTAIANYIASKAFKLANGSALTRFDFTQTNDTRFKIGKCLDILFVARPVAGYVTTINSTVSVDIDSNSAELIQYDSDRITDNNFDGYLVVKFIVDSVEYHRKVTISSNTLTLYEGTTQYPSANGAIAALGTTTDPVFFELINGYDVLARNLESYPVDSDGYVIKDITPNSDCYVEFIGNETPNYGDKVCIYAYIIDDYSQDYPYQEQIYQYGQYLKNLDIKAPLTESDIEALEVELEKQKVPLETVNITSYRKNPLPENTKIKALLEPLFSGDLFCIENKCKIFSVYSIYPDSQVIEQKIKLASYVSNLASTLAKANVRNELSEARTAQKLRPVSSFDIVYDFINNQEDQSNNIAPPVAIAATVQTNTSINANWDLSVDSYNGWYRLDVSTASDFSSFVSGYESKIVQGTSHSVTGLSAGTTYYYRLRSISFSEGESLNSNTITTNTTASKMLYYNGSDSYLYLADINGSNAVKVDPSTISTPAEYSCATFSGGNLIVYASNKSGDWDLYSVEFDLSTNAIDTGSRTQYSKVGAQEQPKGRTVDNKVCYRDNGGTVYIIDNDFANDESSGVSPSGEPALHPLYYHSVYSYNNQIYKRDFVSSTNVASGTNTSITSSGNRKILPYYSDDFAYIFYKDDNTGYIMRMTAAGASQTSLVTSGTNRGNISFYNGKVYYSNNSSGNYLAYSMETDGSNKTALFASANNIYLQDIKDLS